MSPTATTTAPAPAATAPVSTPTPPANGTTTAAGAPTASSAPPAPQEAPPPAEAGAPAGAVAPPAPAGSPAGRPSLPLQARPRRQRVRREPTPRAAARSLRRTAPRTTTSTWRRSGLPGPALATAGARPAEVVSALVVVGLLFVPVAVWTQAAAASFVALALAVLAVAHLAWARRVVVGADYVAVRRLGRYHVASADHVRHLELRLMQGGSLCLHTDDGRCMRLRRVELQADGVAAGLRELAGCTSGTRDRRVCALLELAEEEGRIVDRYVPGL